MEAKPHQDPEAGGADHSAEGNEAEDSKPAHDTTTSPRRALMT